MTTFIGDSLKGIYQPTSPIAMRELVDYVLSAQPQTRSSASLAPDLESHALPDLVRDPRILAPETYFSLTPFREENIGTASFDFRLGGLVARGDTVLSEVTENDLLKMDYQRLEPGEPFKFIYDSDGRNVYYFTSLEAASLSQNLSIDVHAKSTTGRVGCHTRGVGVTSDRNLITLLQPLAFDLIARSGETSFAQGVVRYRDSPYATPEEITDRNLVSFGEYGPEEFLSPLGAVIRFDTSRAYAAKRVDEPIDMSAVGVLDWRNWWEEIKGNSSLVLDAKRLYLLGSKGIMTLNGACGVISKEQNAFNGLGGFGCLAGVVQPGFRGQITMEPFFPNKTQIQDGDVAGYVLIDPVEGELSRGSYEGDYQGQTAPRLPKMFRQD